MKLSDYISVFVAAGIGLAVSAGAAAAVEAVARSAVNVRSGPGVSHARIDALYAGEAVNVTQCRRSWCYVEHLGPNGWVSKNFLRATGSSAPSGGSGSSSAAGDAAAAAILGAIVGGILSNSPSTPLPEPELAYGPDTCKSGYVWRDAIPGDHVCVRPSRRTAAANENSIAGSRVDPDGAYGPNSCRSGFVWREAYTGDVVCVTGARRTQVRNENTNGPSHRVLAP